MTRSSRRKRLYLTVILDGEARYYGEVFDTEGNVLGQTTRRYATRTDAREAGMKLLVSIQDRQRGEALAGGTDGD